MSGLIDPTMAILGQALDGLTSKQAVISSNLANIDTPNYQPQTVDFETALQNELSSQSSSFSTALPPSAGPSADVAMKTNNASQYSSLGSSAGTATANVAATSENLRNDGNKVDLETEMTALTETQIKYEADARLMSGKFTMLYDVLGGH
jgi:flagellar basal-body rod protein FlgB